MFAIALPNSAQCDTLGVAALFYLAPQLTVLTATAFGIPGVDTLVTGFTWIITIVCAGTQIFAVVETTTSPAGRYAFLMDCVATQRALGWAGTVPGVIQFSLSMVFISAGLGASPELGAAMMTMLLVHITGAAMASLLAEVGQQLEDRALAGRSNLDVQSWDRLTA